MTVKRYKPNIKAKAYINELSKPTVKSETNQKVVFQQSLFPLRDNRAKKTHERASARELSFPRGYSPHVWKAAGVVTFPNGGQFSHSLVCSFCSTNPERKEKLLLVELKRKQQCNKAVLLSE